VQGAKAHPKGVENPKKLRTRKTTQAGKRGDGTVRMKQWDQKPVSIKGGQTRVMAEARNRKGKEEKRDEGK